MDFITDNNVRELPNCQNMQWLKNIFFHPPLCYLNCLKDIPFINRKVNLNCPIPTHSETPKPPKPQDDFCKPLSKKGNFVSGSRNDQHQINLQNDFPCYPQKILEGKEEIRAHVLAFAQIVNLDLVQSATLGVFCVNMAEYTEAEKEVMVGQLKDMLVDSSSHLKQWIEQRLIYSYYKGLIAQNHTNETVNIVAAKGFIIFGQHCREDGFPGTILYYLELKILTYRDWWEPEISLSETKGYLNSYAITTGYWCYYCRLAGESHRFEFPEEAILPKQKANGNVYGCGLVLDPSDKVAIFFTLNGQVLCKPITITPSVHCLFPTVRLYDDAAIEVNFGDDPAKPFDYDIQKCPGLELACI